MRPFSDSRAAIGEPIHIKQNGTETVVVTTRERDQEGRLTGKEVEITTDKNLWVVQREEDRKADDKANKVGSYGKHFTTTTVVETEARLIARVEAMAKNKVAKLDDEVVRLAAEQSGFNAGQKLAFELLCSDQQITAVNGAPGSGKSYLLSKVLKSHEAAGYTGYGAILQGKTAEDLERDSGINSQTLHSFLQKLDNANRAPDEGESMRSYEGRFANGSAIRLGAKSIVFVDEAGMVGSRQFEQLTAHIEKSGAKLVLVGDSYQLSAVEYGDDAFSQIKSKVSNVSLTEIMRQKETWARDASKAFAKHDVASGMRAYSDRGCVLRSETQADAQAALVASWAKLRREHHEDSLLVLCSTNRERNSLNNSMRAELQRQGLLQNEQVITTDTGARMMMAVGEEVMFTKNDKALGVKNGTSGKVIGIDEYSLTVRTVDGKEVSVDRHEAALSLSYAITIHKAQGATVDRCLGLFSPYTRAEAMAVFGTRHRTDLQMYWSQENFKDEAALVKSLSKSDNKTFSGDREWTSVRSSDSVVSQLIADHSSKEIIERAGRQAKMIEINANLDAQRLLDHLSKSHGLNPDKYEIRRHKDGSDRIVSLEQKKMWSAQAFVSKEMNLDLKREGMPLLKQLYAEQLESVYSTQRFALGERLQSDELFRGFKSWKKSNDAEYQVKVDALDQKKVVASEASKEAFELRKVEITAKEIKPVAQRKELAAARREFAAEVRGASAEYKEQKAALKDFYKKSSTELFKDYVHAEAVNGNETAIDQLRRTATSKADHDRAAAFGVDRPAPIFEKKPLQDALSSTSHGLDLAKANRAAKMIADQEAINSAKRAAEAKHSRSI